MSLASASGSLTTSGSMLTTGGPTAPIARPQGSPMQHKSRQRLRSVRIPIREARRRQIAAEPLFKHRYSLEVEPQDPTHSAEDAKPEEECGFSITGLSPCERRSGLRPRRSCWSGRGASGGHCSRSPNGGYVRASRLSGQSQRSATRVGVAIPYSSATACISVAVSWEAIVRICSLMSLRRRPSLKAPSWRSM